MAENKTYNDSPTFIPARLESSVHGLNPVADAKDIYDINHDKWQNDINEEVEAVPAEIERIDGELGNRYTKEETYNKTEVDTKESGLQGQINTIKGGSTKSIATIDNEINSSNGINERLQTVEALGEISVGGGDIQIATGADFDDPDASQKVKAVTVGAVLGGIINTPVFDLTVYTGDTYADLEAALAVMGDVSFPAQLKKGGMIIKFVQSSDNNYIQARLMANAFTTDITKWQVVDDEPTAGSDNLVKSGGVAVYTKIVEENKASIKTIDSFLGVSTFVLKEEVDGSLVFKLTKTGTFVLRIDKISGNQSVFSIRAKNTSTSATTTLKSNCSFNTDYEVTIPSGYDSLFIYQGAVTPVNESNYELRIYDDDNLKNVVNANMLDDQVQDVEIEKTANDLGIIFEDVSEQVDGSLSFQKVLTNKSIRVVVDKIQGNQTTFSIRGTSSTDPSAPHERFFNNCSFGTAYDVVFPDGYDTLFIYQAASSTDIKVTKYVVTIDNTIATKTRIKNIQNITDSIYGGIHQQTFKEQSDYSLSYQYFNVTNSKLLLVRVEKIVGNHSTFSVRLFNQSTTKKIVSDGVFGLTYCIDDIDTAEWDGVLVYQGNAGSDIPYGNTEYNVTISNINGYLDEDVQCLNLAAKRVLMLGDSITQLPRSGETISGFGVVEYFSQKTKATTYRGGFGGAHLSERVDLSNVTTITTDAQAKSALDVVNIVRALVSQNWSLQEQAVERLTDTYYATVLATLKSINLNSIDIITIFAGTNDCNSSIVIGDSDSTNSMQYVGAINTIVQLLSTNYPNLKVFLFTPIVRWWDGAWSDTSKWSDNYTNGNGKKLIDYANAVMESGIRHKVPACNLYTEMGWNIWNFRNFCVGSDGTHPARGYQHIASKMAAFILSHLNKY